MLVAMEQQHEGGSAGGGSENPAQALRELVHELATLLDGSRRCLSLAQRDLDAGRESGESRRQLETVRGALDRMADLVRCAMSGAAVSIGSDALGTCTPVSLAQAVRHARDVLAMRAAACGARIVLRLGDGVEELPAGRLYVVVLNGIRNAIEAIERDGRPGSVFVSCMIEGGEVSLEISDDGPGLDGQVHGSGVGLGLSRSIVEAMGGSLALVERDEGGACLRVRVPAPVGGGGVRIGP